MFLPDNLELPDSLMFLLTVLVFCNGLPNEWDYRICFVWHKGRAEKEDQKFNPCKRCFPDVLDYKCQNSYILTMLIWEFWNPINQEDLGLKKADGSLLLS